MGSMKFLRLALPIALSAFAGAAAAASTCSASITGVHPSPSVAPGYSARLVTKGLAYPRGLIFDTEGHLLVVDQGKGIVSLTVEDDGSCVSVNGQKNVVSNPRLTHGIQLSADGKTLYASSAEALFSWDYDPKRSRTTSDARMLVDNMANSDHSTRTLLLSKMVDGMMLISRGSSSNVDKAANNIKSGHSQLKAFNVTAIDSVLNFSKDGVLIGWGLRNSVGVAEDPATGAIYSVENSVDEMMRDGEDIHQDNPGEELNFHGYLNRTDYTNRKINFGYPKCFSAWDVDTIPNNDGMEVGTQFARGSDNEKPDAYCQQETVRARLAFQAHMAPLDMKFNADGSVAFVTFHGSWDRTDPVGYKLSMIKFADGQPVAPRNSQDAAIDVLVNRNPGKCPTDCIRPVGLAWDAQGRLFMSSDATGEIYVVEVPEAKSVRTRSVNSAPSKTESGMSTTSSGAGSTNKILSRSSGALMVVLATFGVFF